MVSRKILLRQGLWYFFFNSIVFLLIAIRYFKYYSGTDNLLTILYLVITTLSHFIALSSLLFLIFLPVILVYPNKTLAWITAAVLSTTGSMLLFLDTLVFDLYRMHINRFILELLFGGAGSQIFEFHIKQYILTVGVLVAVLAAMLFVARKFFYWSKPLRFRKGWLIAASVAIMMFGTHFIHAWAEAANFTSVTRTSRFYPLFFPTSDRELMLKLGLVNENQSRNNLLMSADNQNNDLNYPQHPIVCDSNSKTNIIVILLDSWYYKSFDSVAMPNIYTFSKNCEVYTKHYSGSNGTRTGVFSLFYGIPGIYWDVILANLKGPVLVDLLLKNKYEVKTFTSASLISPPFDRTVFRKIKNLTYETTGNSVCDRDIQLTKDWIGVSGRYKPSAGSNPVFSFLFYDALHSITHPKDYKGPFQPEWEYAEYESLNNNTNPTPFLNLYKNSAHFVDSLVGIVLNDLKAKGLLANSWVIISGDHGQEFNDNKKNYWGHNGNYSAAQMQVPMLVYKPGGKHAIYNHWTCHYDLVPTLLKEIFHCKNPISDYSVGKLLDDPSSRDWLLVGSSDNYAILLPDRIISVYFDGSFDITDSHLNPIDEQEMQAQLINQILFTSKSYYKNQ